MNIQEFRKDRDERYGRVKDLNNEIEKDLENIKSLENDYKIALENGDEKSADNIFPKITNLKNKVEGNRYKAEQLKTLNKNAINSNAIDTLNTLKEIEKEYMVKAVELSERAKPIEEELVKLHQEGFALQNEYEQINREYHSLKDSYNISTSNLPSFPILAKQLPIFENNRFSPWVQRVVVKSGNSSINNVNKAREEKIKKLPEGACFADYAKANRLIQD